MSMQVRAARGRPGDVGPLAALGFVAIIALSGCAGVQEPVRYPERPSATSAVETTEIVHAVWFGTNSAELDQRERRSLEAFVAGLPKDRPVRAVVVGHTDDRASDAYNDRLSERRAASVAATLRRIGIAELETSVRGLGERFPVDPRPDEAARALNRRVEVRVRTDVVTPRRCGDWSYPLGGDPTNGRFAELGCSTRANLERMVADPRDLIRGRDLGPADAVRESGAIQRYHEDRVKAPVAASSTSAQ